MSFEWTNDWCGRQAPREVRAYRRRIEGCKRDDGIFVKESSRGIRGRESKCRDVRE